MKATLNMAVFVVVGGFFTWPWWLITPYSHLTSPRVDCEHWAGFVWSRIQFRLDSFIWKQIKQANCMCLRCSPRQRMSAIAQTEF